MAFKRYNAPMKPLRLHFLAVFVSAALAFVIVPANGDDGLPHEFAGLSRGDSATVREIVDGDTVILDDGRQVRLVGIQAPKLPLDARISKNGRSPTKQKRRSPTWSWDAA